MTSFRTSAQLKGFEFSTANDAKGGTVSVNCHWCGRRSLRTSSTGNYPGSCQISTRPLPWQQSLCVLNLDPDGTKALHLDKRSAQCQGL